MGALRELFEVGAELSALDAAVDGTGGELTPEGEAALAALTTRLEKELAAGLDEVVNYLERLKMREAAARAEADEYLARARAEARKAARVKEAVADLLARLGIPKCYTATGRRVWVQQNSTRPLVLDEIIPPGLVPDEFLRKELNKVAITEALKDGRELPFARLGPAGKHIRHS